MHARKNIKSLNAKKNILYSGKAYFKNKRGIKTFSDKQINWGN